MLICPLAFCIHKFNMISLPKRISSKYFQCFSLFTLSFGRSACPNSGIFRYPGSPLLPLHRSLAEMCLHCPSAISSPCFLWWVSCFQPHVPHFIDLLLEKVLDGSSLIAFSKRMHGGNSVVALVLAC